MLKRLTAHLNVLAHCRELNVEPWSCPRFLFLMFGIIIMIAIMMAYLIAERYAEPDIVIVLVTILTVLLLSMAQVIVNAFEKVVRARQQEMVRTKEVLELKDQFVYIAIHDIASSATAIKWGIRTIEPELAKLSGIEKEVFGSIRDRNEKLIELARQILLITRIESGQLEITQATVNPHEIIAQTIAELVRLSLAKGIMVIYDPPKEPLAIVSDPIHLAIILRLLLTNAFNHADPEHGAVRVAITATEKNLRIDIENNGPEMTGEARAHVFEKFWRYAGSTRIEGTGFGLYIVKRLVEALSGEVTYSSVPEKTTFSIILPK